MRFDKILCIADPLRNTRAFPEGFFDLLHEPIAQGADFDIKHLAGGQHPHALLPGFCLEHFRQLSAGDAGDWKERWGATYFKLPDQALEYFLAHLPPGSLLLCFEMPAWLSEACTAREIPYLDIRVSPLRFARDLYIAMRTNVETLYRRISAAAVSCEELRLEAGALAANVRMHRRRFEEFGQTGPSLGRSLVFVGQAPYDASLLTPSGTPLRCQQLIDDLLERVDGRRLLHKPHPFSMEFGATERQMLESVSGLQVEICNMNAYQLLTSDDDVQLIGLSSGLLQEASWFGKTAHTLYRPYVPLASPDILDLELFQQVHFAAWCSPGFWHRLLSPHRAAPALDKLPTLPHNYGRETLDQWWDYSKVLTWQRALPHESFLRSGGQQLRNDLTQLQATVNQLSQAINES
ncbi:hypothetical protein [Pseudomonas rustica]